MYENAKDQPTSADLKKLLIPIVPFLSQKPTDMSEISSGFSSTVTPFTTATLVSDKTKHTFQHQTTLQSKAHITELPQEREGFNYHHTHS